MKLFFCVLISVLLTLTSYTQVKVLEVTHYLFPEFSKGMVLMKTGVQNDADLNYNSLTEEMIFDNRGIKLAIDHLELVDTVYIQGRKFVPLNNKFLELIHQSKYCLYAEHRSKLKDPGKPSGYGGTSQTAATTTFSSFSTGNRMYDLKLPEGYETRPYTIYWLTRDGNMLKFVSVRQLSKLFDDKSSLVKGYLKKHSVRYDNQESMVQLLKFLEIN